MKTKIIALLLSSNFLISINAEAQKWTTYYDYDKSLYGFENSETGERKPLKYSRAYLVDDKNPLYTVVEEGNEDNRKYGIIDNNTLKEVFPVEFDEIKHSGKIIAVGKKKKDSEYEKEFDLYNTDLKNIYSKKADGFFMQIQNDYISFKNIDDELYGVLDYTGKIIIPFQYSRVKIFDDNLFVIKNESYKELIVDNNQKTIIPPTEGSYYEYEDGLFILEKYDSKSSSSTYHLIDINGKELLKTAVGTLTFNFYNKNIGATLIEESVKSKDKNNEAVYKKTIYDKKGKQLVAPEYESIKPFSGSVFEVGIGPYEKRKLGVFDSKTSKILIPIQYYSINYDAEAKEYFYKCYKDKEYTNFDLYDVSGKLLKNKN